MNFFPRRSHFTDMTARFLICLFLLSSPFIAGADLANQPIIKLYVGKWTAEGELRAKDGNTILVSQTWEGKADGENAFLIEGQRTVNSEQQSFKWSIAHNAATDLLEATLTAQDGNTIRFEAHASEADSSLELKAVTGSGGSSISIKDQFSGEGMDVMESTIVFTDEQGQTTLEGKITHRREKAP
jgi:hypothetical protein